MADKRYQKPMAGTDIEISNHAQDILGTPNKGNIL